MQEKIEQLNNEKVSLSQLSSGVMSNTKLRSGQVIGLTSQKSNSKSEQESSSHIKEQFSKMKPKN